MKKGKLINGLASGTFIVESENDGSISVYDIEHEDEKDYKKGYNILMTYWDSLPDEDKPKIDKELKEAGL